MKYLCVFLFMVVLGACSGGGDPVSGTFIRTIDNEYALGNDTLIIKAINATTYQVEKRSTFQRTVKVRGKIPALESKKRAWMAIYEPDHKHLREPKQGKLIIFSDDFKLLVMRNMQFRRLEE